MESSTNESEFRNVLERYSDILKIENDNIEPVIRNSFYQSISNRDRIYTSGGFVLKVLDDQDILAMPIGEYKNLVIGSEAITWEETETIRKITYNSSPSHKQISSAKTNDCGLNFPWASYFDNHGGCSDDREVFVTAEAFIAVSIQTFIFKYQTEVQIWYRYPSTEIKVWGKLRNWLCSWRDYKTELNLRNVDYTVVSYSTQSVGYWGFPTLSTPTTTRVVLPPVNTPETYLYAKLQRIPDHLIDEWDVLTIEPYRFIEIHMEASSRGVGNNWAIIDCR